MCFHLSESVQIPQGAHSRDSCTQLLEEASAAAECVAQLHQQREVAARELKEVQRQAATEQGGCLGQTQDGLHRFVN